MKKILIILVFTLSILSVNAASLCGGGFKFVFSGGEQGTFVLYRSSGGEMGRGNYQTDYKGNIRYIFKGSYEVNKLTYVSDGVFDMNDDVRLKECKD
ncbi:MAG: hypothetical protein LBP63_01060 [Prevotellaceae bacterium]|jgi:hypothetical protein|nr:hypothetical protein [Prevotellaceae bacterium]